MSAIYSSQRLYHKGFAIVELLIVVVVIAILAAISTATYSGIQQRARNVAIISAASQSLRMIQAYIAANGSYPYSGSGTWVCITNASECYTDSAAYTNNSTFDAAIATVGTVPSSVPKTDTTRYGLMYQYATGRTMDGVVQPARLIYYLFGTAQPCGLAGSAATNGTELTLLSATYALADAGGSGKTLCLISIPGPST